MVSKVIYKTRNGKLTRVGMFLGVVIDGELRIGHSLCSKEDEFDFDYAVALASIRTLLPDEVPPSIQASKDAFEAYCRNYYADKLYNLSQFIIEVS